MIERPFRVLVGVLHSGESEYPLCVNSARQQTGVDVNIFTISGKENKNAHDALYDEFMRNAAGYDFFFKLDADMSIRTPTGLKTLVEHAAEHNAAHLMSYVLDCPSGLLIPGVQLFRSDSRWEGSDDNLNVDYPPRIFGKSLLLTRNAYVDHMTDPHDYQLFRYGIHKALKAIQPGRGANKSITKFLLHTAILNGIARNSRAGQERLSWALIGAMLVLIDQIPDVPYHSHETQSMFNALKTEPTKRSRAAEAALEIFFNEVQVLFRFCSKLHQS